MPSSLTGGWAGGILKTTRLSRGITMSLTLELSPTQESELQSAASREGMPVPDYAHRLLVTALQIQLPVRTAPPASVGVDRRAALEADAARAFVASGMSEEELDEYAVGVTKQVRANWREQDTAL